MNAGPCPECGEELALDQRYCINCGHRAETSLAPSYHPVFDGMGERGDARRGFPIPIPIATTFAAATLAFGVVMGTAISPNLSGLVAGEHISGPTVVQAPAPAPEPEKDKGAATTPKGSSGFGGSSAFDTSFGSSGFYGTTGSSGSTGGSGGVTPPSGGKKKPKPDYTYLTGTVVHQNTVASSYSISSGAGLSAIHTSKALPSVGAKVKVPIRVLANGTYAEEAKRQVQGTVTNAKFSGVVTDSRDGLVAGDPDVYTVSARGASVLVLAPDATGTTASPGVGSLISTTVEIRNSAAVTFPLPLPPGTCLPPATSLPGPPTIFPSKQLFQTAPPTPLVATPVTTTVIETVVQTTCTAPGRAVLSSDDIRQGQSDVSLPTAAGIDPARLVPGEAVMASVTIAVGALTEVTGTASDQGIKGADSNAGNQGNLARVARKTEIRIAKASSRPRK